MIVWGLMIIFVFTSVYYSYWFLIAVALLGLWKAWQFWFYKSRPWRRIHYPAMRLYSSVAGYEAGEAESENREFDFKNALSTFVRALKPDWELDTMVLSILLCKIVISQFLKKRQVVTHFSYRV